MKKGSIAFFILSLWLAASSAAIAADFDWIKDFNIQAQADPSGFQARIAARFQVGDAKISAVLGNVQHPADAYMVFKLGEMSHQPPEEVVDVYKKNKGKGWGDLAKSLGIKPGSSEFHALKSGHDLEDRDRDGKKGKGKEEKPKGGKGKN